MSQAGILCENLCETFIVKSAKVSHSVENQQTENPHKFKKLPNFNEVVKSGVLYS
jgi:hypothetical protein